MNKKIVIRDHLELEQKFKIVHNQLLTDEDVKQLSTCILDKVDDFCRQHDIKYSLAYGTLLGAIRHRGYIPWDDDIDIMMCRPDYERFIAEFPHGKDTVYSVVSFETDKNFHYPFAKVVCNATLNDELGYVEYGHGIDLFPVDKIPLERKQALKLLKQQHISWMIFMIKLIKWDSKRGLVKNLFMCIAKLIYGLIPYSSIHKQMKKRVEKYRGLRDYNLGCLFSPYGEREIMPKDIYERVITQPFEGGLYNCLKEYDRYLSNIYGDYMQLPPEEKRVSHHDFQAYWK